jgi:hypothetical protein
LIEDLREGLPSEWARARNKARSADGRSPRDIGTDFEKKTASLLHRNYKRRYGLHFNENDGSNGPGDLVGGGNGLYYSIQCEDHKDSDKLESDKALRVWAFAELQTNTVPLYAGSDKDGSPEFFLIKADESNGGLKPYYEPFDWDAHLAERAEAMSERERMLFEMTLPRGRRRSRAEPS